MSNTEDFDSKLEIAEPPQDPEKQEKPSTSGMSGDRPKKVGRRPGRRSSKMDVRAKLERSRQSARECRARKKMRYQYLEDLVVNREKAVFALREELELCKKLCAAIDGEMIPEGMMETLCRDLHMDLTESVAKDTARDRQTTYFPTVAGLGDDVPDDEDGGSDWDNSYNLLPGVAEAPMDKGSLGHGRTGRDCDADIKLSDTNTNWSLGPVQNISKDKHHAIAGSVSVNQEGATIMLQESENISNKEVKDVPTPKGSVYVHDIDILRPYYDTGLCDVPDYNGNVFNHMRGSNSRLPTILEEYED